MSGDNAKDFTMTYDVLQRLLRKSRSLWRRRLDLNKSALKPRTIENYNEVITLKPPISSEELERQIKEKSKSKTHTLRLNKPLLLPPLDKNSDFIPLLFLECDLDKLSYAVSLRIEMYRYEKDNEKKPQGFGFRFEMHEKPSAHDYAHVQIVNEDDRGPLPQCPDWLPTTIPAIPAKAECPVSLILCMLVSFYGKKMYNRIFTADLSIEDRCKRQLKDLL